MEIDLNEYPSQQEKVSMEIDLNEDYSQSQQDVVTMSPSSQCKIGWNTEKRSSTPKLKTFSSSFDKKITCNDQKLNRPAFLKIDENTVLYYKYNGETLATGRKKGDKILCICCDTELSPSQFEAHAGLGSRKKPYANIYLSDGVSIHELASSVLLQESVDISQFACIICREYSFEEDKDIFNERTSLVCDQCEKEYHIGCLWEQGIAQLQKLPSGKWFCSKDCSRLHNVLKACVKYSPIPIPTHMKDVLKKKLRKCDTNNVTDFDADWFIVRGNDASKKNRLLLAEAFAIFQDCFNPIIDSVTGQDFLPSMTYGKEIGDMDFFGVHCAMLVINSKLITAGLFRVLGHEIVELSIAATCRPYQMMGYFQMFFTCFEMCLGYLKIQKIVVPAAKVVKDMWIDKFGFKEVNREQLFEYKKSRSMVRFIGTTLLEKEVPKVAYTYENDRY
ncbi:increased DNA methylation 1-like isoform X2 [Rutidosis leptorrhynchoides]|uniref:increased DNA methylation 1-like isoform X2 n=1 Tax=Rutidosis leptorrhynchoides TaxID=125765 RepID=UPI003A99C799